MMDPGHQRLDPQQLRAVGVNIDEVLSQSEALSKFPKVDRFFYQSLAARNTANAGLNTAAGRQLGDGELARKPDSLYSQAEFTQLQAYFRARSLPVRFSGVVYVRGRVAFNPAQSADAQKRFARSLNGGMTWSTPTTVASINSMRANPPVGYKYSDNMGATWSSAIPLGPAVPATGIKRRWPVVSVQPGGVVDVVYYESMEAQATPNPTDIECNISIATGQRRVGMVSSLVDTYWIQSRNSGGNRVLATWADGRNGVPDTFFAHGLGAGRSP